VKDQKKDVLNNLTFFKWMVLSNTLRYSTLRYATLRYATLLYATVRYSTLLYATLRYCSSAVDTKRTTYIHAAHASDSNFRSESDGI
jgi:hypothetical protein